MTVSKGKKRFNLHLKKDDAELVRDFIKESSFQISFSGYIDILLSIVADNIREFQKDSTRKHMEYHELFEILKIKEMAQDHADLSLEHLLNDNPKLAIELMKYAKLKFSDRYHKKQGILTDEKIGEIVRNYKDKQE